MEEMTVGEIMKYGMCKIFEKNTIKGEELREPDIVCSDGEIIELTDDEKRVLALGPKFCIRKKIENGGI